MAKKTIRVDESDFEIAKERKQENGQTWGEYLTDENRTGPSTDDVVSELTARVNVDTGDAMENIDELQKAVKALTNDVEDLESNLSVSLEASERSKIAREVVEELR